MTRWKITFVGGASRTVSADTLFEAKRKVLRGLGAHRLPPIACIGIVEDAPTPEDIKAAARDLLNRTVEL